jgi:short-subunit dehydrogenase
MSVAEYSTPLSYIGLATASYLTYKFTKQTTTFLTPSTLQTNYNPNQKTSANWALVTGASDGIGFGFSQELCARGFNVILHGRNAAKLEKRQRELAAEFPDAKTESLVLDVSSLKKENVNAIADQVRFILEKNGGGMLTVLVNNIGGEMKASSTLSELTYEDVDATIALNAGFMTQISRVLVPVLEANGVPGLILNVSSAAAFGLPYITVYSGSKGFVESFTGALSAEMKAEGKMIEVMALKSAEVQSGGYDIPTSLFVPTARMLASAGLNRVGCGREIVWAYFWHWVQGISMDVLPRWVLMKFSVAKLKGIREWMLEKEKRKNA